MKTKYFFLGFITSLLLTLAIPSLAQGIVENIQVSLNSVNVKYNGVPVTADNFVYNGRTYLQVKTICEVLNKELKWDEPTQSVIINDYPIATKPQLPTNDIKDSNNTTNNSSDNLTTNESTTNDSVSNDSSNSSNDNTSSDSSTNNDSSTNSQPTEPEYLDFKFIGTQGDNNIIECVQKSKEYVIKQTGDVQVNKTYRGYFEEKDNQLFLYFYDDNDKLIKNEIR